ncbi:MAG: translation initiation factor IF-2 subunit gamma [Thaumarchaeota archaeon]|nr:translation initiation factor IF-2 subunit gamma [Nitrososphaerota archaeon]
MSEQKLAEPSQPQAVLPKQPEVNIGTSGHVDHGKCEKFSDYAIVDGQPLTGYEIENLVSKSGKLVMKVDGGEFYSFDENRVVSIDEHYQPTIARAGFYKEHYAGPMVNVSTSTGRKISVTPAHPLLINRNGNILWMPAEKLVQGDFVAILRNLPLPEDAAFRNPLEEMRKWYPVVTWDDCQQLRVATEDFTWLDALFGDKIERMRILAGMSTSGLCREAHISPEAYHRVLQGELTSSTARAKVIDALSKRKFVSITRGEFLINLKQGKYLVRRLRNFDMDDDLVKWFAFVWSEGSSSSNHVDVTQTVQRKMLREWLRISEEKLGEHVVQYPNGRCSIYNRAFVAYLELKFGFRPGNESVCHILPWVCKLPTLQKRTFLRWFLTLDGEFDEYSGQIMVSQSNEKNIVILSYLLHSFGIVPRFGEKTAQLKDGKKVYHRLSISGRRDLSVFSKEIGFEDPRVQHKLTRYLRGIKRESKETNFSIPIDPESVREHLLLAGLCREGLGGQILPRMKYRPWYKAYEMAFRSSRLSRAKLLLIIREADEQLRRLEASLVTLGTSTKRVLPHMSLAGLPQEITASELGYSRRKLMRIIRNGTKQELESLVEHVETRTRANMKEVESWLTQLRRLATTPLEFDRIVAIENEPYDGFVFDLNVPGPRSFIGGTSSIVCHNTTLTQAITGVWASAHSEELKRGITIKVGYADAAFYKCSQNHGVSSYSTSPKCPIDGRKTTFLRAVSFVDTPGHESLMTNMLAGAFLMDGALLVIAANEPVPKPQTREHLQALQMLGMKKIVIAQNKIDLVTDAEAKKNYSQIEKFVKGTVAEGAPIVPISAQQRLNIDALIEALEDVIPTPKRDSNAKPLMYVVRSFDVNRPGSEIQGLSGGVLGGSLTRGELKVGEEIEVRPGMVDERSGKFVPVITRISSLQTGAGAAEKVGPGGLVAVGTHLDPTYIKGDQMVGSVIGKPGALPETLEHVTLDVTLLETAVGSADLVKVDKVKLGETVRLNLGTASTLAVATSVRGSVVEVDLKKPVAIESGMRAAISRRIAERWRLIGSGVLK